MDPLRREKIERARATPPEERARQALELSRLGIRLKRASLKLRFPSESDEEIDARLQRWLERAE